MCMLHSPLHRFYLKDYEIKRRVEQSPTFIRRVRMESKDFVRSRFTCNYDGRDLGLSARPLDTHPV